MASAFDYDIEWESVPGSRGRENRATWGRLRLAVDGQPVTRVLDHRAKSYRDHILIPLYPITEWLVTHWWSLLFEPEAPGRQGYEQRHNLRFGREGYAFPDLRVQPAGASVTLAWAPLAIESSVSFTAAGVSSVAREAFQDSLAQWVDLVVARLEQQGIEDTPLQDEWSAIQAIDDHERAFCVAAAQLGQDPYDVSPPLAEAIVQAADTLPAAWRDDFFSAVGVEQLPAQVDYALRLRDTACQQPVPLGGMVALRAGTEKIDPRRSPWQQGYDIARRLRSQQGVGIGPLPSDTALATMLGVDRLPLAELGADRPGRWLDALVDVDEDGAGGFLATSRRPESRRFAFCRALFEYLTAAESTSALVTVARSERQKRNRAFAAELLAPSEWLRQRCGGELLGAEDIEDAADALGVSSEVVRWQAKNHNIARIVD